MSIELSPEAVDSLHDNARDLLDELVTEEVIYASSNLGWEGLYHALFGRDSAITASFIFDSLQYGGDRVLAKKAMSALRNMSRYQGREDNAATGEQRGKIAHEVRAVTERSIHHGPGTNKEAWYIDPEDNLLKNWDSVDATPLWILAMIRGAKGLDEELNDDDIENIRLGIEWIITNIKEYHGLVGFTGADKQVGRTKSGLHNQSWKDSGDAYQTLEKDYPEHPIKDVFVNASAWAALRVGAELFREDDDFYNEVISQANALRDKFNNELEGFIIPDTKLLSQAIDGDGNQLPQQSIDAGAVLWAYADGLINELCVDDDIADSLVAKMISEEMLNPEAGIRNYEKGTEFREGGTNYHASAYTYWPFMSMLVAQGMLNYGADYEAEKVMKATLKAIEYLGTNIEMFIQNTNDEFEPWSHPDSEIPQKSAREQAWTAGGVYWATLCLKNRLRKEVQ